MTRTIVIDPVTRIEGHSKITIQMNDAGEVDQAYFHVTQFRGFETLCEGRPFAEMPSLMARICGICPVSHLMASAKACDVIMSVRIPPTAVKLRKIMNLGQIVQSHALSFFYLSSPDFLLGMDADPAKRNIIGVLQANPELARGGIRLRQFGQQVIELLGGKRIHPAWVVPGGVSEALDPAKREKILQDIPEVLPIAVKALKWFQGEMDRFSEEIDHFANFDTLFMAPVGEGGTLEHYHSQHGQLRVIDSRGNIVAIHVIADQYPDFIGEAVEPYTYLKFPYYKPLGYPAGIYRVGPLARLNVATKAGTRHADEAMREWKKMGIVSSSFHFHLARLIEIVHGIEKIEELLNEEDILDKHVRATAGVNNLEGIGISEAPRGTLIHHYRVNEFGQMEWANLIIATGHNNLAMNQGVTQVAKHFVKGQQITEGMLNRVEAVIRCYDPCLSCSTHALGEMPLEVQLVDPAGKVLDQVRR